MSVSVDKISMGFLALLLFNIAASFLSMYLGQPILVHDIPSELMLWVHVAVIVMCCIHVIFNVFVNLFGRVNLKSQVFNFYQNHLVKMMFFSVFLLFYLLCCFVGGNAIIFSSIIAVAWLLMPLFVGYLFYLITQLQILTYLGFSGKKTPVHLFSISLLSIIILAVSSVFNFFQFIFLDYSHYVAVEDFRVPALVIVAYVFSLTFILLIRLCSSVQTRRMRSLSDTTNDLAPDAIKSEFYELVLLSALSVLFSIVIFAVSNGYISVISLEQLMLIDDLSVLYSYIFAILAVLNLLIFPMYLSCVAIGCAFDFRRK